MELEDWEKAWHKYERFCRLLDKYPDESYAELQVRLEAGEDADV